MQSSAMETAEIAASHATAAEARVAHRGHFGPGTAPRTAPTTPRAACVTGLPLLMVVTARRPPIPARATQAAAGSG